MYECIMSGKVEELNMQFNQMLTILATPCLRSLLQLFSQPRRLLNIAMPCSSVDFVSYNYSIVLFVSYFQVYPGSWTAILISLDNVGTWNIRAENLDKWYLGQETYMKIINPEENGETEMAPPSNVLYCGALRSLQT